MGRGGIAVCPLLAADSSLAASSSMSIAKHAHVQELVHDPPQDFPSLVAKTRSPHTKRCGRICGKGQVVPQSGERKLLGGVGQWLSTTDHTPGVCHCIGVIISELECDGKNKLKQLQFLVCEIFQGLPSVASLCLRVSFFAPSSARAMISFWKTMAVFDCGGRIPDDMPQETVPRKN